MTKLVTKLCIVLKQVLASKSKGSSEYFNRNNIYLSNVEICALYYNTYIYQYYIGHIHCIQVTLLENKSDTDLYRFLSAFFVCFTLPKKLLLHQYTDKRLDLESKIPNVETSDICKNNMFNIKKYV